MSAQPDTDTPGVDAEVRHLHAVESTDAEVIDSELADTTDGGDQGVGERVRAAATWAAATFTPESGLYTDRQPAIAETVRRARYGTHLPESGPLRTAAIAYGYGAAAVTAVLDTCKWIVAHPARLGVLVVLLTLAALFDPTRQILTFLLTPLVWLHTALT